jgi:hypothetical protein
MAKKVILLLCLLGMLTPGVYPATYVVPDDYSSIQAAIDQAVTGDTILVRPGVYPENLLIEHKGLYISVYDEWSIPGILCQAIVDGRKLDYTVQVMQCTDTVILRGLTICNGLGEHSGGVRCGASNLVMEHVLIRDNATWRSEAHGGGGMTAANGSYVKMKDVVISGNYGYNFGGGIKIRYNTILEGEDVMIVNNICSGGGHSKGGGISVDYDSHLYLYRSVISDNYAGQWGGGIALGGIGFTSVHLVNVTITGNLAGFGGGAIYSCYDDNQVFLANCILANNNADAYLPEDHEVFLGDAGTNNRLAFCYSNIEGGLGNMTILAGNLATELEGNLDELPYFHTDLSLLQASPCIDAGIDYYEYWGEVMVDIPLSHFYGEMPDMGAYENWDVLLELPVDQVKEEGWVEVFPNPANNTLSVEIMDPGDKNVTIIIMDEKGKMARQNRFRVNKHKMTTLILNVEGLRPGVYILELRTGQKKTTEKVIVI